MKYIDEYRDPALVQALLKAIRLRAEEVEKPVNIMEVCGSHTYAIGRFGLRDMLPSTIRLISGPGCPVCVTSARDVDTALYLAGLEEVIFATFGDMLRVPGSGRASLQERRALGADVRVVSSPTECISLAEKNPGRTIIFMGIGFETTSPTVASFVRNCRRKSIDNLSVFSVHKVIPPALKILMDDPDLNIDGFLCPGHVSTMIGADAYAGIRDAGRAAVITGFEPVDILEGILKILEQIRNNRFEVEIQYGRGVKKEGNPTAMRMLHEVFEPADAEWRGLGVIPASGLALRWEYAEFDVFQKIEIPAIESREIPGCCCGDILRGIKNPNECPLFKRACSPLNPVGPCMVSSEGTCAAYYKYY